MILRNFEQQVTTVKDFGDLFFQSFLELFEGISGERCWLFLNFQPSRVTRPGFAAGALGSHYTASLNAHNPHPRPQRPPRSLCALLPLLLNQSDRDFGFLAKFFGFFLGRGQR